MMIRRYAVAHCRFIPSANDVLNCLLRERNIVRDGHTLRGLLTLQAIIPTATGKKDRQNQKAPHCAPTFAHVVPPSVLI